MTIAELIENLNKYPPGMRAETDDKHWLTKNKSIGSSREVTKIIDMTDHVLIYSDKLEKENSV